MVSVDGGYLLQWNWSPHSFCHASTTAVLSFIWPSSVHSLLPLQNCVAHLIVPVKLTSLPCFNLCTGSQSNGNKIQHSINTLCYKCITGTAPSYLCDCLQLYTPSRTLRSASNTLSLRIPRTRLSSVGSRAFSVFGPATYLPLPLRKKQSLDSFKRRPRSISFPKQ